MPNLIYFCRGICLAAEPRHSASAIALLALIFTTTSSLSLAAPTIPPAYNSDLPAADAPRNLASFDNPGALSTHFIERGASQFTAVSRDGLAWSPTATNICTLILAKQGIPRTPTDKTIAASFRLPTDGASFGVHLHGKSESAPSHLILVSRTATDRGLIRAYRTPIWPPHAIAATDLLPSAQIRVPVFPSNGWYRLAITTQINLSTAETTLAIQLFDDTDGSLLASLDALDPGPALPGAGLIALRLFAPSGGRIDVRALTAQP